MVEDFLRSGWLRQAHDPAVAAWARAAREAGLRAVADPEQREAWLVCDGTWFVGVDALPNDALGAVGDVHLPRRALALAEQLYGPLDLHKGQVSVTYPGYPRPRAGESPAAFRYREKRDAAHVDGLLGVGPAKRRHLRERHAWLLGLPLTDCGEGASPFVIWEGSHEVMRAAFRQALAGEAPATWGEVDLTDVYKAARAEVFETCKRVTVMARPGESYLVHRLALHGVAPWTEGAPAPADGRMVAYFRPEFPGLGADWLEAP